MHCLIEAMSDWLRLEARGLASNIVIWSKDLRSLYRIVCTLYMYIGGISTSCGIL